MSFEIGDEVVCVKAGPHPAPFTYIPPFEVLGRHYTIKAVGPWKWGAGEWVELEEVGPGKFLSERFRKVKKQDIELFRAMCVSPKPLVPCSGDSGLVVKSCTWFTPGK